MMKSNFQIIKRLYVDYSKNYIWKIILSGIFSLVVAERHQDCIFIRSSNKKYL